MNESRVALITGAGQGLGRVFAQTLAAEGIAVAVADLKESAVSETVQEIESLGGTAFPVSGDVSNEANVAAMTDRVLERFGRLDILINNASIFSTLVMRPFDEIPVEEWRRVIDVNITGVFLCSRAAVKAMKANNWGRIINISSAVVPMGRANYLHYVASKAGVQGMTRAMAREMGEYGITVNAILPGATETEIKRATVSQQQREQLISMRSIRRVQKPGDLTGIVRFLASDGSAFITGQSIIVDGGAVFL